MGDEEGKSTFMCTLQNFDVSMCECVDGSDKEKMQSVIYAAFGDVENFNREISQMLQAASLHGDCVVGHPDRWPPLGLASIRSCLRRVVLAGFCYDCIVHEVLHGTPISSADSRRQALMVTPV